MSDSNVSLFAIEQALADLMSAREEVTDAAEIAAVEEALREYCQREVDKVDGVRAYLRWCSTMAAAAKEEAERMARLAAIWSGRAERLKGFCQLAMEAGGKTRLEGRTGTLLLKGNGGLAPLNLQPELIPDECCEYVGKVAGPLWLRTVSLCPWLEQPFAGDGVKMERRPSNDLIRRELKHGHVPGASLGERGIHLEVR